MEQNSPFNIHLVRYGRKELYSLKCGYNEKLVSLIKALPKETRSYNAIDKNWDVNVKGLYELMTQVKGTNEFFFKFQDDEQRTQFANLLTKLRNRAIKQKEKVEYIENLDKDILQYKEDLKEIAKTFDYKPFLKEGIVPMQHQIIGALFCKKLADSNTNSLLAMDLGTGKAQPLDSLVLTPNGYKRMGDIQIGDEVINSKGKISHVKGVFPQGKKKVYEVTFSDNTKTKCCDEHLWTVQTSKHRTKNRGWFTFSLKELIEKGLHHYPKLGSEWKSVSRGKINKWHIPMVSPIEFETKDYIIDPYVMGCLLGDGSFRGINSVSFTTIDSEIYNEIEKRLPLDHKFSKKSKSENEISYYIVNSKNSKDNVKYKNIFVSEIDRLGLSMKNSHNKFIPNEYKYGNILQRLDLVQGLMDTDGTVGRYGTNIEYTSVSERLIDDMIYMIQSLGGTAKKRKKKTDKNGFTSFTITVSLPPELSPFKLTRKVNLHKPKTKYKPYRMIKEVDYIGEEECQCISVSAEDSLYLTDNCIVTHNTITAILSVEMMPDVKKCLFIVPANLRLNIQNEVHKFTNSFCYVPRLKKKDGKYAFVKYKRNQGRSFDECKYFVLSYDYFSDNNFDPELKIQELGFDQTDIIVYDEFQYLSSKKSLRFENIKQSFEGMVKKEIGLSATPLVGNVSKFFPLLKKLKPLVFSNESKFRQEFCGQRYFKKPMDYNMQWHTVETPRLNELNDMLQPIMYRVKKEEVLHNLPPLTINQVIIEMTDAERKEYGDIYCGLAKIDWESNALVSDEDTATTSALNILMRMRQFTSKVKLRKAKEMIDEFNEYGEKVVFFDTFKEPLYNLERSLGNNSRLYTGDQSGDRKQTLVDEFQSDNSEFLNLLVSLMAGNAGITLTKSRTIIQNSLSLIPHENTQAYGRIHRNGQTEKCNVYILTLADTVDEMIYENYMSLQSMINAVIDNENMEEVLESMELDIIKKLKDEATKKPKG